MFEYSCTVRERRGSGEAGDGWGGRWPVRRVGGRGEAFESERVVRQVSSTMRRAANPTDHVADGQHGTDGRSVLYLSTRLVVLLLVSFGALGEVGAELG